VGDNRSRLLVTAQAPASGGADEELALDVEGKILDELGVKYKIAETERR
jgi:hypothetical protein